MNASSGDNKIAEEEKREPLRITSYQTNKVPWYIHGLWMTFTASSIIYLLTLAIPDFIRWW